MSLYLGGSALAPADASVAHLSALKKLKTLTLVNTPNLTDPGNAVLPKSLPECKISR